MGSIETRKYAYEDLRTMPQNGNRYELIGGEVHVTPSPNTKHQRVAGNLHYEIRRFVEARGLGEAWRSPSLACFAESGGRLNYFSLCARA
jgi:Uma2 family endonuclease